MQKVKAILKSKLFILLMIILGIILFFTIKKEYEYRTRYKFVTENAAKYIKDKYGFDAEIVSIPEKNSSLWDNAGGCIEIKMQHEGDEFWVTAFIFETACLDNYQEDEITAAIEEYLHEKLPDGKITDISLTSHLRPLAYCISDYYDGTNLEQILDNNNADFEMVFADREFSEADIAGLPFDDVDLIAFDTAEHRDEFVSRIPVFRLDKNKDYQKYTPHITDYIGKSKDEITRLDVTILETDEFVYACFLSTSDTFLKTLNEVTMKNADHPDLHQQFENYGEELRVSKPISKEYYYNNWNDAYIYYPIENLSDYDLQNIGVAWSANAGTVDAHGVSGLELCGEYAVFTPPYSDCRFMLVDNTGQESYVPNNTSKP